MRNADGSDTVVGAGGGGGTGSGGHASMSALRSSSDHLTSLVTHLSGRSVANDGGGGTFYWDAGSSVTDDGAKVIKPASVSGNGRWIRNAPIHHFNVLWYGAKNDGSTDDSAAIQAAIDAMEASPQRTVELYFPGANDTSKVYKVSQTFTIRRSCRIYGDFAQNLGASSTIKWAAGTHGFVIQHGDIGTLPDAGEDTIIEGLAIEGGVGSIPTWTSDQLDDSLTSSGSSYYPSITPCGICIFANNVAVRNCWVGYWEFDGIHIEAVGSDKNANDFELDRIQLVRNGRHGVYCCGDNTSAGIGTHLVGTGGGGAYTVYDRSFLGCTWVALHSEGNLHSFFTPLGGSTQNSSFVGCYQEASDGPATFGDNTVVVGGTWGNGIVGNPMMIGTIPGQSAGIRGTFLGNMYPTVNAIVRSATTPGSYELHNVDTLAFAVTVDSTLGYTLLQLTAAASATNQVMWIKRIPDSVGYLCRIQATGGIDGISPVYLGPNECLLLQSDGTTWRVLNRFTGGVGKLAISPVDAWNSGNTTAVTPGAGDFTMGVKLYFTQPCTVTGIRIYYPDGTSRTVRAGLWDGSTNLATVDVTMAGAGVAIMPFASPVTIGAADTYKTHYVSLYDTSGSHKIWGASSKANWTSGTLGPVVPFVNGDVLIVDQGTYAASDALPSTTDSVVYAVEPVFTIP
jgi:hypothetical protein